MIFTHPKIQKHPAVVRSTARASQFFFSRDFQEEARQNLSQEIKEEMSLLDRD